MFAATAPHSLPARPPVQSALVPWQLPRLADPLVADVAGAVDRIGDALRVGGAAAAGVGLEMPQSWPVGQSAHEPWQSPGMQPPQRQTVEAP